MQNDADFLSAFQRCVLDPKQFRHPDHLRMAWIYLKTHTLLETLKLLPRALRRYAESLGATDKYHETLTWAFVFLIHERICASPDLDDWRDFLLRYPELEEKSLLSAYYLPQTLQSPIAKKIFVFPDALPSQVGPQTEAALAGVARIS